MQLPNSLAASEYGKAQALDMSNQYYSTEPVSKYPPSTTNSTTPAPYNLSSPHSSSDNPSITSPTATATAAAMTFPRFPYDIKPGYEPENLSTTEAFMRQYGNSAVTAACHNPYSAAQERLHQAVHQQVPRNFPANGYPSPPAVMPNAANPAGLPMFPWMRSSISGKFRVEQSPTII